LQIGEFEAYGWLASEGIPLESMDRLHVGEDAANCWKSAGSRIMLSSDTYSWSDSHVEVVADVPSEPGTVPVYPLSKKKSAEDETFGYPDFAVEVALLDRSLIIEGAKDEGAFATLGGHFIVLHTPHVHQHLEGALMYNMGQGKSSKYRSFYVASLKTLTILFIFKPGSLEGTLCISTCLNVCTEALSLRM